MKILLTTAYVFILFSLLGQSVPLPQPVEQRHPINPLWWLLGVLLAIGVGVIIYMLIKKDPKRDAVR